MAKIANSIVGTYSICNKTSLIHKENNSKLVVKQRTNPTKSKPLNFLISLSNGKFEYVSSMFKVDNQTYTLDYKGVNYELTKNSNNTEVLIKPKCK